MVINVRLTFCPVVSGLHSASFHREALSDVTVPDSKPLSSSKSLVTSGLPLKKIKTTGTFFFLEGKEEGGKGRGEERKINLQSSGTSQSLYRLFHAPSKMYGFLGLPRLCVSLLQGQQHGLCHPRSLSFSLKWQQ